MKIWGNIGGLAKLVWSILRVNKYIKPIEEARAKGDFALERERIAEGVGVWVNDVIRIFDLSFIIQGRENIPDGPCVFIGNHQAYADIIAMLKAVEGKQLGFIAKEEFKPVPLMADWILRIRGLFIPTNASDPRESLRVINEGVELLNNGFSLMIYPEGRRSWGPEMGEFKPGSFKLATKAKVPVVPVTVDGTYRMFEENERITPGQSATVIIHPPIETAGMSKEEQKALPARVYEIVKSALSEADFSPDEPAETP